MLTFRWVRNPVTCHKNRIRTIIPQTLLTCHQTIQRALGRTRQGCLETCWTDSGSIAMPEWHQDGDVPYAGGTVMETGYRMILKASEAQVWDSVEDRREYRMACLAFPLDLQRPYRSSLVDSIGLRKRRRDPHELHPGDPVDFFRVLHVQKPHFLKLLAEMKFPGEITLEFRIQGRKNGTTELLQLSRYVPHGVPGLIFWYGIYPFHRWVFKNMIRGIGRANKKPVIRGPEFFPSAKNR